MRLQFILLLVFGLHLHAQPAIIPVPASLKVTSQSRIHLNKGITFHMPTDSTWQSVSAYFQRALTALKIPNTATRESRTGALPHFVFQIAANSLEHADAYKIVSFENGTVTVVAHSARGAFYAVQTILQSIDLQTFPVMIVEDHPRFPYRGMHLDVGRHMFPVSFIKQYIDLLAEYKFNTFHWHLTEDQGWRIEIKKYPKLQTIAAYRPETLVGHYNSTPQKFDGKRYGGYYSQAEVRQIVQYAKERFITIIPEIEMPGHAQAALAAYPELSCTGQVKHAATKWGVFEDVFCTKDETFRFLEDVLTEVMDLFPGTYIHIGGDECPKARWKSCPNCQKRMQQLGLHEEEELQSWFIKRIEQFLNQNGRRLIGWDEILEGGLAPNATVMSWRGTEGGRAAAAAGHDVVMTPTSHCYFDYYQSTRQSEDISIGGYLPLEKVYAFEPIPTDIPIDKQHHILGVQGNVWTEYMPTPERVLYMALPRMQALAEVAWAQPARKDLADFCKRLERHMTRWKSRNLRFGNTLHHVRAQILTEPNRGAFAHLSTLAGSKPILWKKKGSKYTTYKEPLHLKDSVTITAMTTDSSTIAGFTFAPHLGNYAQVTLEHAPAPQYAGSGVQSPFNGVSGSDSRYGDAEWLGLQGADFAAHLQWAQPVTFYSVSFRFYHAPGQWIHAPTRIEIHDESSSVSRLLAQHDMILSEDKLQFIKLDVKGKDVSKLKVKVFNLGKIPEGNQGAGNAAWLFVDEVRIR